MSRFMFFTNTVVIYMYLFNLLSAVSSSIREVFRIRRENRRVRKNNSDGSYYEATRFKGHLMTNRQDERQTITFGL